MRWRGDTRIGKPLDWQSKPTVPHAEANVPESGESDSGNDIVPTQRRRRLFHRESEWN